MQRSNQLLAWIIGECVENMRVNGDPSKPIALHQLPYPYRFRHRRAPAKPQSDGNTSETKEAEKAVRP